MAKEKKDLLIFQKIYETIPKNKFIVSKKNKIKVVFGFASSQHQHPCNPTSRKPTQSRFQGHVLRKRGKILQQQKKQQRGEERDSQG